ncbi:MAG: hypothetical protein IT429_11515 [Gemmataceae bacterium]|nr:hypothetical protein [Gemmataceae bacterium]
MRRLLVVCVLGLAGCQSVRGPLEPRPPQRVDDPRYSIPEQERRGRAALPLPLESRDIAPPVPAASNPYYVPR